MALDGFSVYMHSAKVISAENWIFLEFVTAYWGIRYWKTIVEYLCCWMLHAVRTLFEICMGYGLILLLLILHFFILWGVVASYLRQLPDWFVMSVLLYRGQRYLSLFFWCWVYHLCIACIVLSLIHFLVGQHSIYWI